MPFFDNTGIDTEARRAPLWSALATLADQLERLIAINLAGAGQALPAIVAFGFPALPVWLRVALVAYTSLALIPATGATYVLVARACAGEHLGIEAARDALRAAAQPAVRGLMPLFAALGLLHVAAGAAEAAGVVALAVLLRVIFLLGCVCAAYWGPLFAEDPARPAIVTLRESIRLTRRFPIHTLLACGASLLALLIGAISVGGMLLVVPVLVALVQMQTYREVKVSEIDR